MSKDMKLIDYPNLEIKARAYEQKTTAKVITNCLDCNESGMENFTQLIGSTSYYVDQVTLNCS